MNGNITETAISLDRLYQLLPMVYRQRDEELGGPLRDLLRVITEQVNIVEKDILQLYENWFIETCQDWVVPYISELIGYQPVHEAGDVATSDNPLRNRILIPRREVARTIQSRRRRGTLALLEEVTRDTAGWPSSAEHLGRSEPWFSPALGRDVQHRGRLVSILRFHAAENDVCPFPCPRRKYIGEGGRHGIRNRHTVDTELEVRMILSNMHLLERSIDGARNRDEHVL